MKQFDLAVIGGGPGGYSAAEYAAARGKRVVLFEKDQLGGTCLNRGCIPAKAMLHAGEILTEIRDADRFGIHVGEAEVDFPKIHEEKNRVIGELRRGVEKLMQTCKVEVVCGSAVITGERTITCGEETYQADDIILATGSVPAIPPIPGADLPGICTSNEIFEGAGKDFASIVIIGGGVIGVETACFYLTLGRQVTIIEAQSELLPLMDKEIGRRAAMYLKKQAAAIFTDARVTAIEGEEGNFTVHFLDKKGKEASQSAEGVLISTGRKASLAGLFGEGMPLPEMERGAIVADDSLRTSITHLYVIGDARYGSMQLAHTAEAEGRNAAAIICGEPVPHDLSVVPACVYTAPEIATVGLTEAAAKDAGIAVHAVKVVTGANGRSLIAGGESGFVKLVIEEETGRILGASLVCPRATDLISEIAVAVERKMTVQELVRPIHPHPTFSAMISSALLKELQRLQ